MQQAAVMERLRIVDQHIQAIMNGFEFLDKRYNRFYAGKVQTNELAVCRTEISECGCCTCL